MFEDLGTLAFDILANVSPERVAAREGGLVIEKRDFETDGSSIGELERVAWLKATDQPRRIDASLLTENRELYGVRGEGEERCRVAHLLERVRRQVSPGRNRRLS